MPFVKQHGNDATSIMQLYCLLLWGLDTNFVLWNKVGCALTWEMTASVESSRFLPHSWTMTTFCQVEHQSFNRSLNNYWTCFDIFWSSWANPVGYIQGVFFNWCPPKNHKFFSVSKFWHLELFWWDLLCNLTLQTFRGGPVNKNTL